MGLPSALLGVLAAATTAIRLLKDEPQELDRRDDNNDEANRQQDEHVRMITAEIAGVRSEIQQARSDKKPNKTRGDWIYDILMLLIVAGGTGAAIYTLVKLDESIDLSRRQMAQTEAFTRMTLDQNLLLAEGNKTLTETVIAVSKESNLIASKASTEEIIRYREDTRAKIATQPITALIKDSVLATVISFRNIGRTTAKDYVQSSRIDIRKPDPDFRPLPTTLVGPAVPGPLEPASTPEDDSSFLINTTVTADMIAQLKTGRLVIYRSGLVAYTDVFGTRRVKQYCKMFNFMTSITTTCYGDGIERIEGQARQPQQR